jgi:hypothetical protein
MHASVVSEESQPNMYSVGGKKLKKKMKGGESMPASVVSEESQSNLYAPFKSNNVPVSGGKKLKKKMKGGSESEGATFMDQRFFNPNAPLANYPEISGNGIKSAYGAIESGDVGTGMLAPYTASTCDTANPNTSMKTGGNKNKKSLKGGKSGPIPYISDAPIKSVEKTIGGAISQFTKFMQTLDNEYLNSVEYVKSIKIGNQRLIQGGKKSTKKTDKKKKLTKKTDKRKKSTKKLKGGSNGSDFALTLNSRGPVNAPDDYWGVPGKQWFRQFTKTGDYIPNSQLPYASTPLLAGVGNNPEVFGYDPLGTDYGSV